MVSVMENFYIDCIKKCVEHVKKDPVKRIRLEELAEASGISRFHLQRIFEAYTGMTLYQLISRLKIEKAALIISQNPGIKFAKAATDVGYKNYSEFKSDFTERFSLSPTAFRKTVKDMTDSEIKNFIEDYPLFMPDEEQSHNLVQLSEKIREVKKFQIAYLRHTGANTGDSSLFIYLYNKLTSWAASKNLLAPEFENIIVYHSPTTPSTDTAVKVSIGISIPEKTETGDDIGRMTLGGQKYLICRFSLKENEYSDAWSLVYRGILPNYKVKPADSFSFELYPSNTKSDDRNRNIVDIYIPVEDA